MNIFDRKIVLKDCLIFHNRLNDKKGKKEKPDTENEKDFEKYAYAIELASVRVTTNSFL